MCNRASSGLPSIVTVALLAGMILALNTAASAQTALKVMVFPGLDNYAIFAAQHKNLFAKHGITIELINTPNSTIQRERLANGEIQIADTAADNVVAMVELAKVDAILVTGGEDGYNRVFAQPDIGSVAELRGKTVLVDAPNTAYALLLYKVLKNAGLDKGDYQVNPVGGTALRFETIINDKAHAAAAVLNAPFSFRAAQAGLKDMGSPAAAIGSYQALGAAVMRAWAQANSDTLVRYIRAIIEGNRWVRDPANKVEATQLLADRLQLPTDVAAKSYALAVDPVDGMAIDAKFDVEGFRNVLKLRAEIEGQWGGTPPAPDKYFDLSYYAKALAGL